MADVRGPQVSRRSPAFERQTRHFAQFCLIQASKIAPKSAVFDSMPIREAGAGGSNPLSPTISSSFFIKNLRKPLGKILSLFAGSAPT